MPLQISLLDSPVREIAETSIKVYRDTIVPTKETRQRRVLIALANCTMPPTAYELFSQMRAAGTANDLNDVRPRLTELWKAGKIERMGKGTCSITGHTAFTWRLR